MHVTLQVTDLTADESCRDDGPPLDTSGCHVRRNAPRRAVHGGIRAAQEVGRNAVVKACAGSTAAAGITPSSPSW